MLHRLVGTIALLLVACGVALYATSREAHDAELAQILELVQSAADLPGGIDRVRGELWPRLALLPPEKRPAAFDVLLHAGTQARDERVRRFAAESLGALGGAGLDEPRRTMAVDFLLDVASDSSAEPLTRSVAIAALPPIDNGDRTTTELFAFARGSRAGTEPQLGQRTSVQEAAIRALGQCRTEDATLRLFALWGDDRVRSAFAEAILQSLAHSPNERTQALLVERIATGDKRSNELVAVIQALGGLGRMLVDAPELQPQAARRAAEIQTVLKGLCQGGSHPEVLATAAIALAGLTASNDRATIEFLEGLLPNLDARDRATLESILEHRLLPPRPVRGGSTDG